MLRSRIKSYRYKVGKNHYIVVQIHQSAIAKTHNGNALASNAANVKIFRKNGRR
ncbi:MAG: hypothetical protein K0R57_2288 [Paenibacillaceae bacterium]|jgi:hypothetical protein|nr:hypothetical protein [Paenibacillaceae bacterium]